ncbi:hypothetical protein OEW28_18535 [Defluviimonas sp. WL0002]|uniref:Uncharacterized protein n=1 Tax=Albidovulum marisflavi TaxID=2984159 RepID=A0ABT2ZHK8_9RHOB|nr:hypothetical protein [Defluviimonas sp. WL0002]MCV2870614.1 hypothetical protein [Defluviimonas sp. WL0002]
MIGIAHYELHSNAEPDRRWCWFSFLIGGDRGRVATEEAALASLKAAAIDCIEVHGELVFPGQAYR